MSNNRPHILTSREPVLPAPGPGKAQWLNVAYAEARGLTLEGIGRISGTSDAYYDWTRRVSVDNGLTWSAPELIPDVVRETPDGGVVDYPSSPHFDPGSGRAYRFVMRRQWPGNKAYTYNWETHRHPLVDHVFVCEENGPPQLLRYEDGADFNPAAPFDPAFLNANQAYLGNSPAFAPDGTVYFPVTCEQSGTVPGQAGMVLFRRDNTSGRWLASNRVQIPPEWSSRGLLEPDVAVLRDGRILVVCRGSNQYIAATMPGRKWFAVSTDGDATLGPIQELRYDDGTSFYSPSSIHRFLRSSHDGRLYWFANIVPGPTDGNEPRHPLQIARIDEDRLAVERDSVTVIDDRQPGEREDLQLSNFIVVEDRENSGQIQLYMSLLAIDPEDFWLTGVYRYRIAVGS